VVICLERGADCLHVVHVVVVVVVVQPMPLPSQNPIVSYVIYILTGFTFLVPAYPGFPGKEVMNCMR